MASRQFATFEVADQLFGVEVHTVQEVLSYNEYTPVPLAPPAVGPGFTDDERRTIAEMMAKGTYGWILLATKDLDGTFERLQASDAEVVQEPVEQPYGIRDCAFRDPAGNLVRIQEVR